MSKRYLNRRDKDRLLIAAGMVTSLEEWVGDMEEHKQKATELKHAKTWVYKYMATLMEGLDTKQLAEIHRLIERREVGFYCQD